MRGFINHGSTLVGSVLSMSGTLFGARGIKIIKGLHKNCRDDEGLASCLWRFTAPGYEVGFVG